MYFLSSGVKGLNCILVDEGISPLKVSGKPLGNCWESYHCMAIVEYSNHCKKL